MVQIRNATLEDLDAIELLWKEMAVLHQDVDPYFTLIPGAEVNHRTYMTGLLQDDEKRIFVAEDKGCILGYILAQVNDYPPIYVHNKYGFIGAISVREPVRRNGIGRKLLNTALNWFFESGIQRVECSVAVENPVSQGFWKGEGFRSYMEKLVMDLRIESDQD